MQRNLVAYDQARRRIDDADVLLFRPRGWFWRVVAQAGRSEYCHAAVAAWWKTHLMCVEMTSSGGRALLLSNVVQRWPGVVDVYRLDAAAAVEHGGFKDRVSCEHLSRVVTSAVVERMIDLTGRRYGWLTLLCLSAYHLPVIRLWMRPPNNDRDRSSLPPICSEAVAEAFSRSAGIDLVLNLADRATEPGDLARSALLKYRFTLDWPVTECGTVHDPRIHGGNNEVRGFGIA